MEGLYIACSPEHYVEDMDLFIYSLTRLKAHKNVIEINIQNIYLQLKL